jgi:hypothetical protein
MRPHPNAQQIKNRENKFYNINTIKGIDEKIKRKNLY